MFSSDRLNPMFCPPVRPAPNMVCLLPLCVRVCVNVGKKIVSTQSASSSEAGKRGFKVNSESSVIFFFFSPSGDAVQFSFVTMQHNKVNTEMKSHFSLSLK